MAKALKKEFQSIMLPKSKTNNWPASNQMMEFQQVGATEWLFHAWPQRSSFAGLSAAWLTTLVGKPGSVVVSKTESRIILVLAKSTYAFAGWDLEICPGTEGDAFRPTRSMALHWHFAHDLDSWLSLPVKPGLSGPHGPLQLVQVGEPTSLPMARIGEGLSLTCQQAKDLLKLHQLPSKGNASRSSLHMLLLDFYLGEADSKEKQAAKDKMAQNLVPQEEVSDDNMSEYAELLERLEDTANQGDPDIKREKDKLKAKRKKNEASKMFAATAQAKPLKTKKKGQAKTKTTKKKRGFGLKKKRKADAQLVPHAEAPAVS